MEQIWNKQIIHCMRNIIKIALNVHNEDLYPNIYIYFFKLKYYGNICRYMFNIIYVIEIP